MMSKGQSFASLLASLSLVSFSSTSDEIVIHAYYVGLLATGQTPTQLTGSMCICVFGTNSQLTYLRRQHWKGCFWCSFPGHLPWFHREALADCYTSEKTLGSIGASESSHQLPFRASSCAKAFQSDSVPLVSFCLCCLCFWCHIQNIIAKTHVMELFSDFFF